MASTLGQENPLRYRGYVYDTETGLYYLQSRYHDPETGRFINADAFTSTGQGLLGNNMFAYCNNNPVNMVDFTGNEAISITVVAGCALQARSILENLFDYGVNDSRNLIVVDARIHHRLHTNAYFTLVNFMIIDAFVSAGPYKESQTKNVEAALRSLAGFIEYLSTF